MGCSWRRPRDLRTLVSPWASHAPDIAALVDRGMSRARLHQVVREGRSMSRRVSKVDAGGHGDEKALKRRVSGQAMHPATARKAAVPPLDVTRDKV
jgi:hypothetical protein